MTRLRYRPRCIGMITWVKSASPMGRITPGLEDVVVSNPTCGVPATESTPMPATETDATAETALAAAATGAATADTVMDNADSADDGNIRSVIVDSEMTFGEFASQHGTTIVLVTHNVFQARRISQRAAFLLDGKIVEIADTETFFESPDDPRTGAFVRGDMIY